MNLAEARRCLAIEDYKSIGEYLCKSARDEQVDEYLRRHVPLEKQDQWDVCANQISRNGGQYVFWDRPFDIEIARYREMPWGCRFDLGVSVEVTDGYKASSIHQEEKIIVTVDSILQNEYSLSRLIDVYIQLLPAVQFRFKKG